MQKTCCFSTSLFWRFGVDLGGPWAPKCDPNCSLGALLGRLGELLGHLEDDLGCTWGVLGALERSWGALGALWGVFWLDFLTIWVNFWLILKMAVSSSKLTFFDFVFAQMIENFIFHTDYSQNTPKYVSK